MLNGVRDESDYVLVILQAFTSVRTCRLMRFPGPNGTVAHAEIETGDSLIIVEDASPYMGTRGRIAVYGHPGATSRGPARQPIVSLHLTVRLDRGSEPLVTDGPFIEGKEVISGYTEIDVADLDEALRMVSLARLSDSGDTPTRSMTRDNRAQITRKPPEASSNASCVSTRHGWRLRSCA